jgi:hypothetical protein
MFQRHLVSLSSERQIPARLAVQNGVKQIQPTSSRPAQDGPVCSIFMARANRIPQPVCPDWLLVFRFSLSIQPNITLQHLSHFQTISPAVDNRGPVPASSATSRRFSVRTACSYTARAIVQDLRRDWPILRH